MDERQVKLLQHEADAYRKVLIRLYCDATSGKRTTMDKVEVARWAEMGIEEGRELHARAKALSNG